MMIFIFQPSVGCGSNTSSVFYAFQCDSDLSCVCAIQLSIKYLDTGHLVISTLKVFSMLIRIRSTKVQVRKYFGVSCYSHFQPPGQQLPSSIIAPYINAHAMEDREKRTLRLTLPSWSCLMLKEDSLPRRSSSCSFLLLATFVAIAPSSHNPLGHQGARTEKMERKHGVCVCGGGSLVLRFSSLAFQLNQKASVAALSVPQCSVLAFQLHCFQAGEYTRKIWQTHCQFIGILNSDGFL